MSKSNKKFPGRNRRNWNPRADEPELRRRVSSRSLSSEVDPLGPEVKGENIQNGFVQFKALAQEESIPDSPFNGFTDQEIKSSATRAALQQEALQSELECLLEPEINVIYACNERAEASLNPTEDTKSKRKSVTKKDLPEKKSKKKAVNDDPSPTVTPEPSRRRGSKRLSKPVEPEPEPDQDVVVEEVPTKKAKKSKKDAAEINGPRQLIRPSVLGGFSSPSPSTPGTSTSLFGASPADLIREGKRQWKPSLKVQEKLDIKSPQDNMKKSITNYADAMATKTNNSGSEHEKIQRILASQWDSRIKKGDNKSTKADDTEETGTKKTTTVQLRESKLELNQSLLEKLRNPSQQVQFYEAIQQSMQSADKTPPKLVNSAISMNPAGVALVEETGKKSKGNNTSATNATPTNNRMPGNIVCGICGAVRYYAFILQAKKFGTFSCEPCRKFISKMIKRVQNGQTVEKVECVHANGACVVPPVLRTSATAGPRKSDSGAEVRCQACWLKLCLIGYKLDESLYDDLRTKLLPDVIRKQLPVGSNRSQCESLTPHRGEILEFNRQVPLSRPLFEGFGAKVKASTAGQQSAQHQNNVVHERLPSGWMKKAVKRLEGDQKGKWDTFLITPDQLILKSPSDLKLYIAKSGAIVDSNIVNFALPKKTAKVDKALQQKDKAKDEEVKAQIQEQLIEKAKPGPASAKRKSVAREMKKLGFEEGLPTNMPRSRESKVPLKYRDFSPDGKKHLTETAKSAKKGSSPEIEVEAAEPVPVASPTPVKRGRGRPRKHPLPLDKASNSGVIGVGTFSIDKDTVRGCLSDLRFKTSKRTVACKECENCLKSDCNKCVYCLDRKKNGGRGHLKKICIERRCLQPKMVGLPALSRFRTKYASHETKRTYVRTATAFATKSVPSSSGFASSFNDDDSNSYSGPPSPVPVESAARPNLSFAALITLALDNLPGQKGTLTMIYQYLMDRFPYFRKDDFKPQWQNSIRHNLSLQKKWFVKGEKSSRGGGSYWRIHPDADKEALLKKRKVFKENSEDVPEALVSSRLSSRKSSFFNPDSEESMEGHSNNLFLAQLAAQKAEPKPKVDTSKMTLEEFLGLNDQSVDACLGFSTHTEKVVSAIDGEEILPPQPMGQDLVTEVVSQPAQTLPPSPKPSPPLPAAKKSVPEFVTAKKSFSNGHVAGSIDFWEQYDPEEVLHDGQSVITTQDLQMEAICFLCGSAGQESMIKCFKCCEPFHEFCVQDLHPELAQDAEGQGWVCLRCAVCKICGDEEELARKRCKDCGLSFHEACLQPNQAKLIEGAEAWTCFQCLRCKSCNASEVSHYLDGVALCSACCLQRKKGSFCPLCQGCYDDNDYETRMMECGKCEGWIHALCEGLDAEKYQVLSHLPDSVIYICKCAKPLPRPSKKSASGLLMGLTVAKPVEAVANSHSLSPSVSLHTFDDVTSQHHVAELNGMPSQEVEVNPEATEVEYVAVPTDVEAPDMDMELLTEQR